MAHTREQLIHLLTEAAEVEHNILCSYLYAIFSLKRGVEEGLTEREADAVARWRRMTLAVAIEEMGHLAMVNNLLVAVGGSAHFDRPNLPVAPGYLPSDFVVRLTPFDEATLDHFIFLERPEDADLEDRDTFQPEVNLERAVPTDELTPSAKDYETIGQLYGMIRESLIAIVDRLGEAAFVERDNQLGPGIVDLPGLELIADLPSALRALATIVEQGEGSPKAGEDSHFARFNGIKREWDELKGLNPAFTPAHPAAHDPVMRRPADLDRRVWITAGESIRQLDLANALYGEVLVLLEQVYAPSMTDDDRRAFANAAIMLMTALTRIGELLARLPANPSCPGTNAGVTFAVPRNLGVRSPNGVVDVTLERLGELSQGYAELFGEDPSPVEKARRLIEEIRGVAKNPPDAVHA